MGTFGRWIQDKHYDTSAKVIARHHSPLSSASSSSVLLLCLLWPRPSCHCRRAFFSLKRRVYPTHVPAHKKTGLHLSAVISDQARGFKAASSPKSQRLFDFFFFFFLPILPLLYFSPLRSHFPNPEHVNLSKRTSAASQRSQKSHVGKSHRTGSALPWT